MDFFADDGTFSESSSEEDQGDECSHPEVVKGICEVCFCQVTEMDSRPKFTIGNKRISGVDYASGSVATVHGVQKTFSEKPNISNTPKAIVSEVCQLYDLVTGNSVMRGTQRLGVIAACFHQAQMARGIIWREKKFLDNFDIKQKDFSKGENLLSSVITIIVPSLEAVITSVGHTLEMSSAAINVAVKFGSAFKSTHHIFVKASTIALGAGLVWALIEMKPRIKKHIKLKIELNLVSYSTLMGVSKSLIKEIYSTVLEVKKIAEKKRAKEDEEDS